jgi:hypothetical protein
LAFARASGSNKELIERQCNRDDQKQRQYRQLFGRRLSLRSAVAAASTSLSPPSLNRLSAMLFDLSTGVAGSVSRVSPGC